MLKANRFVSAFLTFLLFEIRKMGSADLLFGHFLSERDSFWGFLLLRENGANGSHKIAKRGRSLLLSDFGGFFLGSCILRDVLQVAFVEVIFTIKNKWEIP